jgi:hypothetical protein
MAIIPPGFALCSATFQCTGVQRKPVITMGVRFNAHPVAAFINTVWREALTQAGSGCPFEPANMNAVWAVVETKVLANIGGTLFSDVNPTVVQGASISIFESPPPNVSIVIAKKTAQAGRQFRGRLFSPANNIDESSVSNAGIISGGHLTTQQGYWTHVASDIASNSIDIVLLHEPPLVGATPAPTDITSLSVTPLVGTNRRRIR